MFDMYSKPKKKNKKHIKLSQTILIVISKNEIATFKEINTAI